ncbi:unnamed protein product [Mytilus coruscus]|uniref:Uncharacterized protein n=1 Tax=Mytilus coruscus TaxID=42192 RepID=A0A6J8C272_MYTCO|nr:unnamed protein product [Mytilus coruscus]
MPSVEIPAEILATETVSTDVQKPDPKPQKRFKRVSDEEIIEKTAGNQNQQRNTKWAVNILHYHMAMTCLHQNLLQHQYLPCQTAESASVTSNVTSVPSPLSSENAQVNNRTMPMSLIKQPHVIRFISVFVTDKIEAATMASITVLRRFSLC